MRSVAGDFPEGRLLYVPLGPRAARTVEGRGGGVLMPDASVPVATHTGFNPRHADSGQILEYVGSMVPFAHAAAREAASDPRPSIAEGYVNREAYLEQARAAAQRLAGSQYLLAGDVKLCVSTAAGERYNAVTGGGDA